MSIPNIITFGRLLAVPLAVYFILSGELGWAFWVFVVAGISDAVDGAIARMFRARTMLGAYLDPLADKVLLVSVYVALSHVGELPLWLVIMVVFRDAMIVGGVLLLYTLKESLAMQPLGISKINTAVQIALAAAVLAPPGLGLPDPVFWGVDAVRVLVWVCAGTTVLSGLAYVLRGRFLFDRLGGLP
ncbi:CDP-alcohol phosphatidyltransferase family protein [Azospirillum halopraeferens]|uniref:CDP-alcohol phosphatidyltransferase family protein n=1 Tax=Azospirillum halopraeferens TaxID=34010 RepID=UPI000412E6DB|nr:CDP-alcohol phosphatidyltransferase family protein [Azospirillum halopraeferens]